MADFGKGIAIFVVLVCAGCDAVGQKDQVLGRVGSSKILASEVDVAQGPPEPGNPSIDRRLMVFNSLFNTRLWAEAGKAELSTQFGAKIRAQLKQLQVRDVAYLYSKEYLERNFGHTDAQVNSWYEKHKDRFRKDGAILPFMLARDSASIQMVAEERAADIRKYFEENPRNFSDPDTVDVGYLKTVDSMSLVRAIDKIRKGNPFESVALQVLKDSLLLSKKGIFSGIVYGNVPAELLQIPSIYPLLFDSLQKVQPGQFSSISRIMDHDGKTKFQSMYVFKYKTAKPADWAVSKDKATALFVDSWRNTIGRKMFDSLSKVYQLERKPIPLPNLEEIYQKEPKPKTQAMFRLLHWEAADSSRLARQVRGIKSEADFRKYAESQSTNQVTKGNAAELSLIKAGHCLPAGIGMLPGLFQELDGRSPGYLSSILKAPDTGMWHVFWLMEIVPPQDKPFDRVKVALQNRIAASGNDVQDTNFVHSVLAGVPAVLESDLRMLAREVPEDQRRKFNRDRLLDMLEEWAVFAKEGQKLGIDKSEKAVALRHLREADAWAELYRDSILHSTLGYSEKDLLKLYKANPHGLFGRKTFEKARYDLARWLEFPDYVYQREFAIHPELYSKSKTWIEAKPEIFVRIKDIEYTSSDERMSYKLLKRFKAKILDTTFSKKIFHEPKAIFSAGKEYYESRDLGEARMLLQRVRDLKGLDTLAYRATVIIAQTYNEEENYEMALAEYASAYALWPDHPDAYKNLFMKGFILTENLKRDTLALASFQELLKRFPSCELADDADWMVRNIQSGGALVPALLDSITQEEGTPVP